MKWVIVVCQQTANAVLSSEPGPLILPILSSHIPLPRYRILAYSFVPVGHHKQYEIFKYVEYSAAETYLTHIRRSIRRRLIESDRCLTESVYGGSYAHTSRWFSVPLSVERNK